MPERVPAYTLAFDEAGTVTVTVTGAQATAVNPAPLNPAP